MSKKRLGRGMGSGKGGHTSSRGQKGQKSRGGIHILFEGLKVRKSTLKKFPFLRGKGKFAPKQKPVVVDVKKLEGLYKKGDKVTIENLVKNGLVNEKMAVKYGVKVLGKSELKKDLVFEVKFSK
jgi:large subunit ribosomal protein L15